MELSSVVIAHLPSSWLLKNSWIETLIQLRLKSETLFRVFFAVVQDIRNLLRRYSGRLPGCGERKYRRLRIPFRFHLSGWVQI
jgi:hypothetical protein